MLLRLAEPIRVELHLFSDASKEAYATVAYLVCQYESNQLIASKCLVATTKAMTILRVEIMVLSFPAASCSPRDMFQVSIVELT